MITIAIHETMPMSAVSYYRSIGVFSYLHKINDKIQIKILDTITWNTLAGVDILYMERPQQNSDLKALDLAKDFNIKIWVDYDDCLHVIPPDNPSYDFYTKTHALQNVEKAIKKSDIMTVSTAQIKEYYSKFNGNIHIIQNAHNDYKYPFNKIQKTVEAINWRGSATHKNDLYSVAKNIFLISKKEKWAWTFIGNQVEFIVDYIDKKKVFNLKECDIIDYFKFILDLCSAIQIVPLIKNEFNISKSNISWIEGTYAGSCTICPDLPEFHKPGAINYKTKEDLVFNDFDDLYKSNDSFQYLLEKCINSKEFRQKNYIQSYEYIQENLLLSNVNKKRMEIIESII